MKFLRRKEEFLYFILQMIEIYIVYFSNIDMLGLIEVDDHLISFLSWEQLSWGQPSWGQPF